MKRNVCFICRRTVLGESQGTFFSLSTNPLLLPSDFYCNSTNLLPFHSHIPAATVSRDSEKARPRFDSITNLIDAHNLFDEMAQGKPLPPTIQFNKLLGAV